MRKRIIIFRIILILLILCAAGIWYVNKYVLPTQAKNFITQTLEKQLGRKVSLEKISYNPFRGIVLNRLTIFDKEKPQEILAEADNINFNCLILPIFKQRKIIIPILNFNRFKINLYRKENGWWNCEDLLSLKAGADSKGSFQVLIYRISFNDGSISILDNYVRPSFSQEIENINASANFSLLSKINFRLSANTLEKNPIRVNLTGEYNLKQKLLTWKSNINNLDLTSYAPYYKSYLTKVKNFGCTVNISSTGSLDKDMNLTSTQDIYSTNFSFASDNVSGKGTIDIPSEISINLKENKKITYRGQINLLNFNLTNLPYVETVSNINGIINFNNKYISTQNLKGLIYNFIVNLTGNIEDFTNPKANLILTSDLDLSRLKPNLPKNLTDKLSPSSLKGRGHLQVLFNGLLKDDFFSNLKAGLTLKDAALKIPSLPYGLEGITGDISFKKDYLSFEGGIFSYNQTPYRLDASVSNFSQPNIKLNLSSQNLKIDGDFNLEGGDIHLNQVQGKYLNSNFKISGDAFNITHPRLNLYTDIELNLSDLEQMLPALIKDFKIDDFKTWAIKGTCSGRIFISGLLSRPKDLELGIKLNCPSLSVKKITLDNLALDFKMKNGQVSSLLSASPYQGSLNSEIIVDLNSKNPFYQAKLNLNDLDLKSLMKDLDLQKKNITGHLSGQGTFKGYGANLETLKGQAWAEILDGNLWEIPLLGDLSNVLNMPQLRKVTFKQAHGNFTVTNEQIISKDLVLLSKEVALSAQGSLGFDGKIDVMVSTTFDPEFIKQGSFLGALVAGLGSIMQYHIYNTISDPKFEKIIAALQIEEGLPTDFLDRFKNILKGMPK